MKTRATAASITEPLNEEIEGWPWRNMSLRECRQNRRSPLFPRSSGRTAAAEFHELESAVRAMTLSICVLF
jgi:hypothetical protein